MATQQEAVEAADKVFASLSEEDADRLGIWAIGVGPLGVEEGADGHFVFVFAEHPSEIKQWPEGLSLIETAKPVPIRFEGFTAMEVYAELGGQGLPAL